MIYRAFFGGCLVLVCLVSPARASLFSELEQSFEAARQPEAAEVLGTFSGRCVDSVKPDQARTAKFQFRKVYDEKFFPPEFYSQNYYVENRDDFWVPVVFGGEMGEGFHTYRNGQITSTRYYEAPNDQYILLKVASEAGPHEISRLCYFGKKGGSSGGDKKEFLFERVHDVSPGRIVLFNREYDNPLDEITFINRSDWSISVSDILFYDEDGNGWQTEPGVRYLLLPGTPFVTALVKKSRVRDLQLTVHDFTRELEVKAYLRKP